MRCKFKVCLSHDGFAGMGKGMLTLLLLRGPIERSLVTFATTNVNRRYVR